MAQLTPSKKIIPLDNSGAAVRKPVPYKVQNERGMPLDEALEKFIRSRKLGIGGANRQCRERTQTEYRYDLERVFAFMEKRGIVCYNDMRQEDVLLFVEHYQGLDLQASSKNKVMRSLKAFMRWVMKDAECQKMKMVGWVDALPKIPKNAPSLWIPTPAQMQKFRHGFDQSMRWGFRDFVVCHLMLDNGPRIGELCNMTPEHIRFEANMMLVPQEGKTGERLVHFDEETTAPLLKRWLRERERFARTPWLFVNKFGGKCKANTFDQSFADNRTRLGMNDNPEQRITPHTVRHYFCTHYLVNGGTLHGLKNVTGHTSFDTLQIYVHLAEQITFLAQEHKRVSPVKALDTMPKMGTVKKKRNVL